MYDETFISLHGRLFGITPDGLPVSNGRIMFPSPGTGRGRLIYCDPANGAAGRAAYTPGTAVDTLAGALALATEGDNDVVVLLGDGTTAATARLTETLDWSKDATHLVALTAPTWEAQRARVSHETTETANINPLMRVSGDGCYFANFSLFQGVGEAATDEQLFEVTGNRNYFWNVHFGGMGDQVGADRAGSYILKLTGAGENTFEHCAIGLETVQRDAANANLLVRGGSQRNRFVDCEFVMAADDTDPLFVDVNDTNALNGSSLIFRRCMFRNLMNITGASQPSVTATVAADANGTVFFDNCTTMAVKWAAAGTLVQVGSSGSVPEGFNTGVFDQARDS